MAEAVVDDFELVEIQEEHRELRIRMPTLVVQHLVEAVDEQRPVRQARERIDDLAVGDVGL